MKIAHNLHSASKTQPPRTRQGNRRSRSPSPIAVSFKSRVATKQNRPPSPRPRLQKEGGVFNRLGGKERSASARSDSRHKGSHEKETEVQPSKASSRHSRPGTGRKFESEEQ
ncbi:hypothetical protein Tco_0464334 [Tanacetum coccineum]